MKKIFRVFVFSFILFYGCNNPTDRSDSGQADSLVQSADSIIQEGALQEEGKVEALPAPSDNSYEPQSGPEGKLMQSSAEILQKPEKAAQVYLVSTEHDTSFICAECTSIRVHANSFVSEATGKPAVGDVSISVKEFYKLSDMLMQGLSTASGNDILETAGMIYVEANSNGEKCILKKGSSIEIGFPYQNKKEDMQLFSGVQKNDKIDWELIPNTTTKGVREDVTLITLNTGVTELVFTSVDEMPEFPGGSKELKKYLDQNVQYPYSALVQKSAGTVDVTFIINRKGEIGNISITGSVNKALDKAAYWIVSNMPLWKPGRLSGKAVPVAYKLGIFFTLRDVDYTSGLAEKAKQFEKQLENIKLVYGLNLSQIPVYDGNFETLVKDTALATTDVSLINRYIFSSSMLGWINCDRFYDSPAPKINYVVNTGAAEKTKVSLVFHKFNGVLDGSSGTRISKFENVPLGEKVTIVATKRQKNKTLLAMKESVISTKEESDFVFRPVTLEELEENMKKLESIR